MAKKQSASPGKLSDLSLAERVQSILVNAAEGRRSLSDDTQYTTFRRELRKRPLEMPHLITTHPTVDSFSAYVRGIEHRNGRVQVVRDAFRPMLQAIEARSDAPIISEGWTGVKSPAERLRTARALLPLARVAVDSMITTLSEPNPNGAPILDERAEALANLRELHRTLGELLSAIDNGHFEDQLGKGLAAETARYAKRAARSLRDDPMPYLSSALLLGILSACGLPGIGGFLGGVALNVRKHAKSAD